MTEEKSDEKRRGRIADYLPLIRAADGLTLGQICKLSDLEPTTIQNWIKRGYVPHPEAKKYSERHLARILLISELRECMAIDRIGGLLTYINGDTDDVSDDIITEERLYDVFCEMADTLEEARLPLDRIGEVADTAARSLSDIPEPDREKIKTALRIMAYGYAASCCKRQADSMFQTCICFQ
ncbi:MAG: DUF1836 domain-containing protein [Ruminococcus sp.]|nr:DUF1836 domain-containing protein [Ruminococcus sp.]